MSAQNSNLPPTGKLIDVSDDDSEVPVSRSKWQLYQSYLATDLERAKNTFVDTDEGVEENARGSEWLKVRGEYENHPRTVV